MTPGDRLDFDEIARAGFAAGLTPDLLWELTPHEASLFIGARAVREEDRRRAARNLAVSGAWLAAGLTRARRLPMLERLLRPDATLLKGRERDRARADHAELVRRMAAETLED